MLDDALFVSNQVHKKEIELADGTKHTLCFKELSAIEFRKFALAEQSDNDAVKALSIAQIIAASLCDEDGKSALTVEKASMLKPAAMNAIFAAILEVNGQKKD